MTVQTWIAIVGNCAAVCTTGAFVPQVWKIWKQGGRDLSYSMLTIYLFGVLLWLKLWRRTSGWGNISTGYLVGVGLGVAAGGALTGTLVAQSIATATFTGTDPFSFFIGLLGTLTVLISFTFTATWRKGPLKVVARFVQGLSAVGRFFLYIALGATFAGVYVASVSVLIGQAQLVGRFLDQFVLPMLRPLLSQIGLG